MEPTKSLTFSKVFPKGPAMPCLVDFPQKNKLPKKTWFSEAEKGMYLRSPIRCRLDSLNSLGGFALSSALNSEAICRIFGG